MQRKVTHAREEALHKAATAAARPDYKMQAADFTPIAGYFTH